MATESEISEIRIDTVPLAAGTVRLSIGGTLDWSNYHKVDLELQRAFSAGNYRVIINLQKVRLITSAGFGCFIGALDVALHHKGNLVFVHVPSDVREVFNMLGLSRILTFAETEADALARF